MMNRLLIVLVLVALGLQVEAQRGSRGDREKKIEQMKRMQDIITKFDSMSDDEKESAYAELDKIGEEMDKIGIEMDKIFDEMDTDN